jgi:hypothetical protein
MMIASEWSITVKEPKKFGDSTTLKMLKFSAQTSHLILGGGRFGFNTYQGTMLGTLWTQSMSLDPHYRNSCQVLLTKRTKRPGVTPVNAAVSIMAAAKNVPGRLLYINYPCFRRLEDDHDQPKNPACMS